MSSGILLLFASPNSFTGDDLAEFHVHGSNAVIKQFLKDKTGHDYKKIRIRIIFQ